MANSPDVFSRHLQDEIQQLYQTLSEDGKYGHYARIPGRICRCLDYFNVPFSRGAIRERLRSYYLFIGVVDAVIDSSQLEAGREVLEQLVNRIPFFDEETRRSDTRLVTEVLKCHISIEIYPMVLARLGDLYQAVVGERRSSSMSAYIEHRKGIGCLTAEVSYLLIRPLLNAEHEALRRFLQEVGEVGCLIDSVIDLRADDRLGLLSFRPTLKDHLKLMRQMLRDGSKVVFKHPRLLGLFLEGIRDTLLDLLREGREKRMADRPGNP